LKKLGAQELEKMSMAWVPKKSNQTKNDVRAPVATSSTKVKKEKVSHKILSRRFLSTKNDLRLAHHLYSSTMPLTSLPWNSSPGMIGYPPWAYFYPWMQYDFLHHEGVSPNQYTFY